VSRPDVTILCVTRNALDAVRLTLSSLRCFTSERFRILVADNGSTDGTQNYLARLDWIELFHYDPNMQTAGHGTALDALTRHVTTRYFLTLDSDVMFLRDGWLTELRDTLQKSVRIAVGEFEPAVGCYKPRLAPHLLLFDTDAFRALRTSFAGCARIHDPKEAQRWRRRSRRERLTYDEMRSYRSAEFYSTGALIYERLVASGGRWAPTPLRTRRKYRHIGHMSWAADDGDMARSHRTKVAELRQLSSTLPGLER
jgi:GT2 family glycosyltransferase